MVVGGKGMSLELEEMRGVECMNGEIGGCRSMEMGIEDGGLGCGEDWEEADSGG